MTTIKVTNHYLSFPEKHDLVKEAFEGLFQKYILEEMDSDSIFDINLFIEYVLEENDKIETIDFSEIDENMIFCEYTEEDLEALIDDILADEDEEDKGVEFFYDQEEAEEEN